MTRRKRADADGAREDPGWSLDARMRLQHIALAIRSGERLSSDDAEYISRALLDIFEWADPAHALGLVRERTGREIDPADKARQHRAVVDAVRGLCLAGNLAYSRAASILAGKKPFPDPFGGPDRPLGYEAIKGIFERATTADDRTLLRTAVAQQKAAAKLRKASGKTPMQIRQAK